jgi:molybdopterin-guanine dinucleotide biosynthesis protein A
MKIGVVLAGGQSSRMGRDKAQLVYHGQSLLTRMRDLLGEAGADEVWISGKGGIEDRAAIGPLGGIIACLEAAPEDAVLLFCPVDMPLLTADTLRVLFACTEPTTLAPGPLPLILPRASLRAIKAQSDHSLRAIGARALQLGNEDERRNVNTPGDFESLP